MYLKCILHNLPLIIKSFYLQNTYLLHKLSLYNFRVDLLEINKLSYGSTLNTPTKYIVKYYRYKQLNSQYFVQICRIYNEFRYIFACNYFYFILQLKYHGRNRVCRCRYSQPQNNPYMILRLMHQFISYFIQRWLQSFPC